MSIAAVIVAAGRGTRAGGPVPKQWQVLAGQTVAAHTVARFLDHPQIAQVVLVLHRDDMDRADEFTARGCVVAVGGADRAASVQAGLAALAEHHPAKVLIHDVARPCVSDPTIVAVISALETADAAAPAIAVSDALWRAQGDTVTGVQDRTGLMRAQTPQGFCYDTIVAAHHTFKGIAADDIEVARAAGITAHIVQGDENNIKITTPNDFERAAQILRGSMTQTPDIRLGNGFDVHAFGPGDHVTLCGVDIAHTHGLVGHSDADVAMHTVTDAIYGALAEGDIGQHFPPSDPQWKGAASEIFLRHAADLARDMGFKISNVDCTLVCEYPKIGPHAPQMRSVMADILGIDPDRVSIKATTSERLGFTGRSEGIASLATAALVKP